ncbi:hypothetical protein PR048_021457, partial [Dryococelus australis]
MADNWKWWLQQFYWYSVVTNLKKKSPMVQVATFMTVIGQDAANIYNTFTLTEKEENDIEVTKEKFDAYFSPKANLTYERYIFKKLVQVDGQPFDEFLTAIISQGNKCEFQELSDSLLCIKIVVGIVSDSARKASCSTEETFIISTLSQNKNEMYWIETLTLHRNYRVKFKLDTGAQCNVLTTSVASKCECQILPSKTKYLVSFSKDSVPVLGEAKVNVMTNSNKVATVPFVIVDNGFQCILGRESCENLGFIK